MSTAADGREQGCPTSPASAESGSRDRVGNILRDGDTVAVAKDLTVKGSPMWITDGTKVRDIRLVNDVGDHGIACKADGFGAMLLKSGVDRKFRSTP